MRQKPERYWYFLIAILILPALLFNIARVSLINDEAIRLLVALEMWFSGNVWVPTINGTPYFKKPPLYNWILAGVQAVTGQTGPAMSRSLSVAFLLLFTGSIYQYIRKYSPIVALWTAMAFLTSGRVLFWESWHGLIDLCFSWCMFVLIMEISKLAKEKAGILRWIFIYGLVAIGFLLKGLPSVVFLLLSLGILFIGWPQSRRKLFSAPHFLGLLPGLLAVAGYYLVYSQYVGLDKVVEVLFWESLKRTPVERGLGESLLHLILFPPECVYHFLPWTLLLGLLFHRTVRRKLWQMPVIRLLVWFGLINLLPYWLSPEFYPRYVLALLPFLLLPGIWAFHLHQKEETRWYSVLNSVFRWIPVLLLVGSIALFFWSRLDIVPGRYLKATIGTAGLALAVVGQWKFPHHRFLGVVFSLLMLRLIFNFFVLPDRDANDWGALCRADALRIGRSYQDRPMYLFKKTTITELNSFYISRERNEPLHRIHHLPGTDAYLLAGSREVAFLKEPVIDSMRVRTPEKWVYLLLKE